MTEHQKRRLKFAAAAFVLVYLLFSFTNLSLLWPLLEFDGIGFVRFLYFGLSTVLSCFFVAGSHDITEWWSGDE